MSAENKVRLADVWVGVRDPRQTTKVEHNLVELLVVSVSAVLSGADTFVEIEAWAKEKLDWLRQYLTLEQGIPSHDTIGRVFAAIDPDEFGAAFVRWVGQVLPALANGEVVAIDGKTSRRSGRVGCNPEPPKILSSPRRPCHERIQVQVDHLGGALERVVPVPHR
jgi:hypothetical protein